MPTGKVSNFCQSTDNGILINFDSQLERDCYIILRSHYRQDEIKKQVRFNLCSKPASLSYVLDFETPDFYLEVKGNWVFNNNNDRQGFKTKTYWFMNQYPNKPFLCVVSHQPRALIKGINFIPVNQLYKFVKENY